MVASVPSQALAAHAINLATSRIMTTATCASRLKGVAAQHLFSPGPANVRPPWYAYAMIITEIGLWDSEFNTVFTYAADCSLGCGCDFEVVGTYRDDYCVMCT